MREPHRGAALSDLDFDFAAQSDQAADALLGLSAWDASQRWYASYLEVRRSEGTSTDLGSRFLVASQRWYASYLEVRRSEGT